MLPKLFKSVSKRSESEVICQSASPLTLIRSFHQVLNAFMRPAVHQRWMKQPTIDTPISSVMKRPQFDLFLSDVVDALDGTHIPVSISSSARPRYRNRKATLTMNVMAACTFDLQFCYVLAGWEGSAPNSTVLKDALQHDFVIPRGSLLTGRCGYPLIKGLFVPFRNVRCHLNEWGRRGQR